MHYAIALLFARFFFCDVITIAPLRWLCRIARIDHSNRREGIDRDSARMSEDNERANRQREDARKIDTSSARRFP